MLLETEDFVILHLVGISYPPSYLPIGLDPPL